MNQTFKFTILLQINLIVLGTFAPNQFLLPYADPKITIPLFTKAYLRYLKAINNSDGYYERRLEEKNLVPDEVKEWYKNNFMTKPPTTNELITVARSLINERYSGVAELCEQDYFEKIVAESPHYDGLMMWTAIIIHMFFG